MNILNPKERINKMHFGLPKFVCVFLFGHRLGQYVNKCFTHVSIFKVINISLISTQLSINATVNGSSNKK